MELTRRTLLAGSVAAAAAGWLAPRSARAADAGAIGIQLWTVRDALAADFTGTLRRLRELGFTEVEPAGLMGLAAAELRKRLDDAGLAAPSIQADLSDAAIDASLAAAHTLGASHVVSSMLRPGSGPSRFRVPAGGLPPGAPQPMATMTLDDAKRTAELANRVGERARRAGLRYAYHNHDFELAPLAGGIVGYDVLLAETDPAVVELELDCGWMVVGGRNPIEYFERYPGRIPLIHAKDFLPASSGEPGPRFGAELGRGTIDYAPLLAAARTHGLEHCYVEQEGPYSRMSQIDSAAVAYDYLRSIPP
ncbi:MAG TPA: sugar phosphate isomerase/epimerase [Gammaproteobacteria bacterium]|nr:sugar phosphate isomerase/epimerase [Gammaproteobacteria bacterium]